MPNLEELIKAKLKLEAVEKLKSSCFKQQQDFLNDDSKRKALFVARRSGKTWAVAVLLILTCLKLPKTKCLYYGLTAQSAWDTIYMHMIEELCGKFNIPIEINLSKQTITFENRSYIKITGDDANDKQIDKALGGKYGLVVFDECQDINHDLKHWIEDKVGPAMTDLGGTIVMAGTAGRLMGKRYWFQVTKTKDDGSPDPDRLPGWSVHSWNRFDNPHMEVQLKKDYEDRKKLNPHLHEDAGFKQQWLCTWVIEREGIIYKYYPERSKMQDNNLAKILFNPPEFTKWKYIFGMDYGFEDDTALVIAAFHPHDPNMYIVLSYKQPHLLIDDIVEVMEDFIHKYKPIYTVGDCQNKTLAETIRQKHRIPIVPADKLGKEAHVAFLNSDLNAGRIKLLDGYNDVLIEEWNDLTWNEKKRLLGIYKESDSKSNHCADAALYLHHFSKHYRATPPSQPLTAAEQRMKEAEDRYKKKFSLSNEPMDLVDQQDVQDFVALYKNGLY